MDNARQPLGPDPLLAAAVELQAAAVCGPRMLVREVRGRQNMLPFGEEPHAALSCLFNRALAAADRSLAPPAAPADNPALPLLS